MAGAAGMDLGGLRRNKLVKTSKLPSSMVASKEHLNRTARNALVNNFNIKTTKIKHMKEMYIFTMESALDTDLLKELQLKLKLAKLKQMPLFLL